MIDPQDYRIEWVHGIGPTQAGFSASWTQAFNQYLNFPLNDFIEGLWATVFANMMTVLGLNEARVPLTPQEQGAADNLSNALVTVLQARASALRSGPALFGEGKMWLIGRQRMRIYSHPGCWTRGHTSANSRSTW
jgi:hypothetical protein